MSLSIKISFHPTGISLEERFGKDVKYKYFGIDKPRAALEYVGKKMVRMFEQVNDPKFKREELKVGGTD